MSREPENIQKQIDKANRDFRRKYSLGYEVYWREFYENRNNELERKLNRIETEKKT